MKSAKDLPFYALEDLLKKNLSPRGRAFFNTYFDAKPDFSRKPLKKQNIYIAFSEIVLDIFSSEINAARHVFLNINAKSMQPEMLYSVNQQRDVVVVFGLDVFYSRLEPQNLT
jgi:hypothetical protein